jgi:hypothetical protein
MCYALAMIALALTIVIVFCASYFGLRALARQIIHDVPSLELMGLTWMYAVIDVFLSAAGLAVVIAAIAMQ